MSIARDGLWFVIGPALAGLALVFRFPWIGGALLLIGAFNAFFFRDPERRIPSQEGVIVSPADGRIVRIDGAQGPHEGATRISIFLSIFDVHINRAPISGSITNAEYHSGSFLPAFDHAASTRNERNIVTIEDGSTRVVFSQIAGLIARRIVFKKKVGDEVVRGERVGMIRFGSRVDVWLPTGAKVLVKPGDRVQGGASILADLRQAPTGGQGE